MRTIDCIVVHCSATRDGCALSVAALEALHRSRGFAGTGYHYYIRRDGTCHLTRPLQRIGAHVRGCNAHSLGICYEGGLDARGRPADTRTPAQHAALYALIARLRAAYPGSRVCGHRDLSPDANGNGVVEPHEWLKQCPCFDAAAAYGAATVGSTAPALSRSGTAAPIGSDTLAVVRAVAGLPIYSPIKKKQKGGKNTMAMKRSVWDTILKLVIAVASAVAGVLSASAMQF